MNKTVVGRTGMSVMGVAVAMLICTEAAMAQMSRGQTRMGQATAVRTEKREEVNITRMPPPNKTAMVRTPEFNVNVQNTMPKVTRRPREWALFEVKYNSSAKWTDELVFTYHVMTKGKNEEGKEGFSYYTLTVRYIDISKGEHMSCVALPPSQVERHGEPVAVALEITNKEGKVMDSKSESTIPLPKEWWKDSKVLDNAALTRRTGLLDRSKTPFALINADDYEVVQ
ncbi:MAG TPA: hypothetical protein P5125_04915 [Kiritimatiellia bacterium]|nr:hypothetical protein [Kiritimatiellia bacterium]